MAFEEIGVKLTAEGADAFTRDMDRAEKSQRGFTDAVGDSSQRVTGFSQIITGALREIGAVAVQALGEAVQAIGKFVGDSIQIAADFETKLSVIGVTSGATAEQLAAVSKRAADLGADLTLPATSALDAQDAMLELVKAGFTVEQAMAAAKGSLQLATIAEVDAGEAAKISAGILNAFGLEASESERITNILAATAGRFAGEIGDYAQGFQQAGFAFHATGQDADDLAASLGILIQSGLGGSDAGTALKNAMIRLINPTKQASGLMESLGINVYDANGNMRPMQEVIGILNTGLAGMTQEQRNAALGTIFLSDGMKAMIPLLDGGVEGFTEAKNAVNAQGAAQDLAAAKTAGFNGAMAGLGSTMETLQLVIGQALLPILTTLLNEHIIPAASQVLAFAQAFFASSDKVGFLKDALDKLIPGAGFVITAIQNIIAIVVGLIQSFQQGGEATGSWAGAFETAKQVIDTAIAGVNAVIQAVLPIIATFIEEHGDEIMAFVQKTWETIGRVINLAMQFISAVINAVLTFVAGFIKAHGDEILAIITTAWDLIRGVIETVLGIIESIITIALAAIQGDWDTVWKEIQELTDTVWTAIQTLIDKALELIKKVIDLALTFIRDLFADAWEKIKKGVEDKWSEIKLAIEGKFNDIKAAAENVVNNIIGFFERLPGEIAAIGQRAIDGLIGRLNAAIAPIRAAVDSILSAIAGAAAALLGLPPPPSAPEYGAGFSRSAAAPSSNQIAAAGVGATNNYTKNYNLNVAAMQSTGNVIQDFAIMQALAS